MDSVYPTHPDEPFLGETFKRLEDIRAYVQFSIEETKRYHEAYFNPKRKETKLKVGDKVLLFNPGARNKGDSTKLTHFWEGPYELLEQTAPNNFHFDIQTSE